MSKRSALRLTCCLVLIAALAACSTPSAPPEREDLGALIDRLERQTPPRHTDRSTDYFVLQNTEERQQVVLFALGLLDTAYRFGGANPEAGLDCSGMVSYVVQQVSGQQLPHNAARIAAITRPIDVDALQPGDLLFFNTLSRPHSHMGIYLGQGRFVHAPNSRGRVRVERLDNPYFAKRLDGVRALADDS